MMNMRSSDLFLGLPFNIASTAILTQVIATVLHMKPCDISMVLTDAHIYDAHKDAVNIQLGNQVLKHPILEITKDPPALDTDIDEKIRWIEELVLEDFVFQNYHSAAAIKAPML